MTIKSYDAVTIGDEITVFAKQLTSDQISLTIVAPKSIKISRKHRNSAGFFEEDDNGKSKR